jgi:hypothetical protein
MIKPVVIDSPVHRADLPGEALGCAVHVAERGRDVADLVAPRVGAPDAGCPAGQPPRSLGDLCERPGDRSAQHEAEASDQDERDGRRGQLAAGIGSCCTEVSRRRRVEHGGAVALQASQRAQARPGRAEPNRSLTGGRPLTTTSWLETMRVSVAGSMKAGICVLKYVTSTGWAYPGGS